MHKLKHQHLILSTITAIVITGGVAVAADGGFESMPSASGIPDAPLSGDLLMAECLARIPKEHITMNGWIMMRRPKGMDAKEFDFTADIEWGAEIPSAEYAVSNRGGNLIETVSITRSPAGPEILRTTGPEKKASSAPEWNEKIQGTDVTWLDVSLGFLWWKNPKLAGEDEVKGRLCDVVELEPPVKVPGCAKVRVWLDREVKMLLQAAEISADGRENRRLWVRSVKKMNDRWMVRDIEVQSRGTGHRTRIHVLNLDDPVADK